MQSTVFRDPKWLGFNHDNHPVTVSMDQYGSLRQYDPRSSKAFDRKMASFFQAYLSLGLLECLTGKPVPESALLRRSHDGQLTMSLDGVVDILTHWVQLPREYDSEFKDQVERTLLHARDILFYFTDTRAFHYDGAVDDDIPATICFLGCVAEAFTMARVTLYKDEERSRIYEWHLVLLTYHETIKQDALAAGWCPTAYEYLRHDVKLSTLRYAMRKGPTDQRDHAAAGCTTSRCSYTMINPQNYVAKHYPADCVCSLYIKPMIDQIIGLLDEDLIPVLKLVIGDDGEPQLIVRSGSSVEYVAISHVWADGLGSNPETGLPICQVRRLMSLSTSLQQRAGTTAKEVSRLESGDFVWVDALCVPQERKWRNQALKLMGRAYKEAQMVVVLDSTIQACDASSSKEDLLFTIAMSPWMRRLWTLQEAMLSRWLVFEFSKGDLVDFDQLKYEDYQNSPVFFDLYADLYQLIEHRTDGEVVTIEALGHLLSWRTTSKPADEVPAIVSLLNISDDSVLQIISSPPDTRMQKLLLALGSIAKWIVFQSGNKLTEPGFRWAPATLMSVAFGGDASGTAPTAYVGPSGTITPNGLETEFLVFDLGREIELGCRKAWYLSKPGSEGRKDFIIGGPEASVGECSAQYLLCYGPDEPSMLDACIAVLGQIHNGVLQCVYGTKLVINGRGANRDVDGEVIIMKENPMVMSVQIS